MIIQCVTCHFFEVICVNRANSFYPKFFQSLNKRFNNIHAHELHEVQFIWRSRSFGLKKKVLADNLCFILQEWPPVIVGQKEGQAKNTNTFPLRFSRHTHTRCASLDTHTRWFSAHAYLTPLGYFSHCPCRLNPQTFPFLFSRFISFKHNPRHFLSLSSPFFQA